MKRILLILMLLIMATSVFGQRTTSSSTSSLSSTTAISLSLVNQDPDPAIAGEIVEIRLGIENTGGKAAENLLLELVPEYPFELLPGETSIQSVGTVKGYQEDENMKIVKYKIRINKDTTAGSYDLKIKYYEEGSASKIQKSLSVDVESKENAEVIYIDKSILIPGKEDTLTFTINNVGSAPLRDLTFSWINEDKIVLPVGSDNTKYIKYIEVGESAELEYKVIADTNVDAGLYELALTLTYDDPTSDEEKEINTIAGVYVGGGTDFDIAFSESSSGQTSFTIANVGSNPAYSVSVVVPQQTGWRVTGSNSMIIGNLNTGDYTVASFSLQSAASRSFNATSQQRTASQQEIPPQRSTQAQDTLEIQIAYTDTMGKRELVEKEVAVNPQALMSANIAATGTAPTTNFRRMRQQSFFSKYKWYILAFVIVMLFILYRKYKKEKIKNPRFKIKDIFKKR